MRRRFAPLLSVLACLLQLFLMPASAAAQGTTARVVGTVTESSGGVLPGASVTAVNLATGWQREAITNEQGDYVIANVPVGSYSVAAALTGFKRVVRTPVSLDVDQTARVDLALEIGDVTETVEVQALTPLVNSETSSIGQVIGETQVRGLPLNGRNFIQLGLLVPGTTPGTPGANTVPSRQGGVAITANGQRTEQNNWMLDGIDNNASFGGLAVIVPSTEAIDQFRVETSNYSAEFGRAAGAIVNLQIKSGTNQFHGSAYSFLRNDAFDAQNFFDTQKSPLRYSQSGGSLGGPVLRNQTFFFANYEAQRVTRGATAGGLVPTEAMRRGDFSGLATIYDPATYDAATNTRQPFANNQIPAGRLNPIAQRLLAAYPLPNTADPARNFVRQVSNKDDGDQWHLRVDHRLSPSNTLMGRVSYYNTDAANFSALPTNGDTQANRHRGGVGQWTWVGGNLVNELRAGGNHYNFAYYHETSGQDLLQSLGLPFLATDARLNGFPGLSVSGMAALGGNTAVPLDRTENTFQILDSVTWVLGDHSLKMGGGFRWYHGINYQPQRARGQYNFTGVFTAQAGRSYANGFADFLLGLPAQQQLLNPDGLTPNEPKNDQLNLFVQDDWKLLPNVTVNAGVRYEYSGAWTEANNRWGAFDLATGQVVYAKDYDLPSTIPFPSRVAADNVLQRATNLFSPRIGVAWRPFGDGETVVRGAYGYFWSQPTGQDFVNTSLQIPPGLIVDNQSSGSVVPTLSLGQFGFASGGTTQLPTVPSFIAAPYDSRRNPHIQQWNVGIERQLGSTMAASISYVGNRGTDFQESYQANYALPPAAGAIQARRLYPAFGAITLAASDGWSSYHSMQVKVERRFSQGLGMLAAYTWAKAMDQHGGEAEQGGGIQNPTNRAASRGLAGFDLRHRFSVAVNYDLPFGAGQRYAQDGLVSLLAGGWHTSTIVAVRSGFPFSVTASGDTANAGAGTVFANLNGDNHGNLPSGEQTIDRWFNTAAFSAPDPFTFGTAGRNILTGPGAATVDFSVTRDFRLGGERRLQFRAEAFNLFNRVNLGRPNSTVGTAAFGTIRAASAAREMQFALKYLF
jgi:hypothetical protein